MSSPILLDKVKTNFTPLYWTYNLPSGTSTPGTIKGFSDVQGLNNVTAAQTNMTKANELQNPESFRVRSMRIVFLGCNRADVVLFCQTFTNRLIVAGIKLLEAPAEYFPGGAGVVGDPTNGIADPRAITGTEGDPIDITSGMNFRTEHVGIPTVFASNFCMRVYLEGPYSQSIG